MAVTGIGARRRITALMARGWSAEALAAETGLEESVFGYRPSDLAHARAGTLEQVSAAYERLWNAQPPRSTPQERAAAEETLDHARVCGWAPPMALDDDTVDLHEGKPDPKVWRRTASGVQSSAEIAEDVAFIREWDGYSRASAAELAVRLGRSKDSVTQALVRERKAKEAAREKEPELEAAG
jgi:hypothetical protein